MGAIIELDGIQKSYRVGEMDVPVLRGVSLRIEQGEFVALMGSSGSGKSTLMNILGCLDRPSSGRYVLEGTDVSSTTSDDRAHIRNERIGFVFQSFNLLRRITALENVLLPLEYSSAPPTAHEARARAEELLTRVGLGDRMDHQPTKLSGGQQQRVAIARSLICKPRILLADEPTGNLDSRSTHEILEMFHKIHREDRVTVILVTHEPEVAKAAQRTIRVQDGLVVEGAFA